MPTYEFEYLTAYTPSPSGTNITIHVTSDSAVDEWTQIVIYKGLVATVVSDSGDVKITPGGVWATSYTVPSGEDFRVRIRVTSEFQIPRAGFYRPVSPPQEASPTYLPGSFAAFALNPTRKRLW